MIEILFKTFFWMYSVIFLFVMTGALAVYIKEKDYQPLVTSAYCFLLSGYVIILIYLLPTL